MTVQGASRAAAVAATRPYPWPWDGVLDPARMALVLLGTQRWWVERTEGVPAALAALGSLRAAAHSRGVPVILVRHTAAASPWTSRPPALPAAGGPDAVNALARERGRHRGGGGRTGRVSTAGRSSRRCARSARTGLLLAGLGLAGPVHSTMRSRQRPGLRVPAHRRRLRHVDRPTSGRARVSIDHVRRHLRRGRGPTAAVLDALSRVVSADNVARHTHDLPAGRRRALRLALRRRRSTRPAPR